MKNVNYLLVVLLCFFMLNAGAQDGNSTIYTDKRIEFKLPDGAELIKKQKCDNALMRAIPSRYPSFKCATYNTGENIYVALENTSTSRYQDWQYKMFVLDDKLLGAGDLEAGYTIVPILQTDGTFEVLAVDIVRDAIFKKDREISYARYVPDEFGYLELNQGKIDSNSTPSFSQADNSAREYSAQTYTPLNDGSLQSELSNKIFEYLKNEAIVDRSYSGPDDYYNDYFVAKDIKIVDQLTKDNQLIVLTEITSIFIGERPCVYDNNCISEQDLNTKYLGLEKTNRLRSGNVGVAEFKFLFEKWDSGWKIKHINAEIADIGSLL